MVQENIRKRLLFIRPTHAEEVCHGKFSGIVLAGEKENKLKRILEDDSTGRIE